MSGWMDLALCAQTDPDLFFPEKGGSSAAALRVCAACEVRTPCRTAALAGPPVMGVIGGLTEKQRRDIHRNQRRQKSTGKAA